MTDLTNTEITNKLKTIQIETVDKLYRELSQQTDIKPFSIKYNDIANYFFITEMHNTKGSKGISFYDFYNHRDFYYTKSYVKKMLQYYHKKNPCMEEIKILKGIYRLYFGSITNFSLPNVFAVLKKYQPKTVLDPTAGFANRLIGASVCGVQKYIGIDNNINLRQPYKDLQQFLQGCSTMEIKIHIQDCLTIDYSKLEYDMVFTSLPYYNTEVYGGKEKPYKSKSEWETLFYKPLIKQTWEGLQPNGIFAFNVPQQIYNRAFVPLLGECIEKIPLIKRSRNINDYNEFIYVWRK